MEKDQLPEETRAQIEDAWAKTKEMPEGGPKNRMMKLIHLANSKLAQTYDMPLPQDGPLDTVAAAGLKAINYGAGVVQAPILAGAAYAKGQPEYAKQILKDAVLPTTRPAASANEVAARLGVPEGPHASDLPVVGSLYAPPGSERPWYQPNKGGWADPSTRAMGAGAFDLALSPGGYKSVAALLGSGERGALKGLSAIEVQALKKAAADRVGTPPSGLERLKNYGGAVMDPLGTAMDKGGRGLYNSAFTPADRAAADAGAGPVSDIMYRHNVWGGSKDIEAAAEGIKKDLGRGVRKDVATARTLAPNATFPRAQLTADAEQMLGPYGEGGVAGSSSAADRALEKLHGEFDDAYGPTSHPSSSRPSWATESVPGEGNVYAPTSPTPPPAPLKTSFDINELESIKRKQQYKAAVQRAYLDEPPNPARGVNAANNAVNAEMMGEAHAATASRARRAVEDMADAAQPGLGGNINLQNADYQSLKSAQKVLAKNAKEPLYQTIRNSGPTAAIAGAAASIPAYAFSGSNMKWTLGSAALAAGLTSDLARTGIGLSLGKSAPFMSNAIRSYLQNKWGPELRQPSPWDIMDTGDSK